MPPSQKPSLNCVSLIFPCQPEAPGSCGHHFFFFFHFKKNYYSFSFLIFKKMSYWALF